MFKTVLIALVSLLSLGCVTDERSIQFGERFAQKWKDWKMEEENRCWHRHEVAQNELNENIWPYFRRCRDFLLGKKSLAALEIDFSAKDLGDDDAVNFAREIRAGHFRNLEVLDLQKNNIGDGGAEALANVLNRDNTPNLQAVRLQGNRITVRGRAAFWRLVDERKDRLTIFLTDQKLE